MKELTVEPFRNLLLTKTATARKLILCTVLKMRWFGDFTVISQFNNAWRFRRKCLDMQDVDQAYNLVLIQFHSMLKCYEFKRNVMLLIACSDLTSAACPADLCASCWAPPATESWCRAPEERPRSAALCLLLSPCCLVPSSSTWPAGFETKPAVTQSMTFWSRQDLKRLLLYNASTGRG